MGRSDVHRAGRRALVVLLVWALGAGAVVFTGPAGAAPDSDPPEGYEGLAEPQDEPEPIPLGESTSAPAAPEPIGLPTPEVEFPAKANWDVVLGAAGEQAELVEGSAGRASLDDHDDLPVQVTSDAEAIEGETLRVEVLDRTASERIGASGFVFKVSEVGSGNGRRRQPGVLSRTAAAGPVPAKLTVDYSGFANAYGGDYASRLRIVALPSCARQNPIPEGCNTAGVPLPTTNDRENQVLVAEVPDLAGQAVRGDGTVPASATGDQARTTATPVPASNGNTVAVFAVAAATASDQGNWAATPISMSGSWQVSPGSGEFSWSYPMKAPAPAGGSAPSVGLGYSSGSIDGLTGSTNTQATQIGLGWSEFGNAFIERSYRPCAAEGDPLGDLCWGDDNATISLAGISGVLHPLNEQGTEWRAESDPGWKIERMDGARYTDTHGALRWKVTGPDGTQYWFGYGHMPGRVTNSILGVSVIANHSGEPCRGPGDVLAGCKQPWRWYLDRVVDPDGMVQSFIYKKETNWYKPINGWGNARQQYDRNAVLKEIIYGGQGWDANNYSARVTFGTDTRCSQLTLSACPDDLPANATASQYPDTPIDHVCSSSTSATCNVLSPSFFSSLRYTTVTTAVRVGTAWKTVDLYHLRHGWTTPWEPGGAKPTKLHLLGVQHEGKAADGDVAIKGPAIKEPEVVFLYSLLPNRVDVDDPNSMAAMRHNRLAVIVNEFGGQTLVGYARNRVCAKTYNPPLWDENVRDCFPQHIVEGGHRQLAVYHKYLVTAVGEKALDSAPDVVTNYAYEGDPGWAYDFGGFDRGDPQFSFSSWRGYGSTTITKGSSKTQIRVYRGLHGDTKLQSVGGASPVPVHGQRVELVTNLDGTDPHPDLRPLVGRTLDERQFGTVSGQANQVVQSTAYRYTHEVTVPRELSHPDMVYDAMWVGLATKTDTITTDAAPEPNVVRQRRTNSTWNEIPDIKVFQLASTLEEGWLDEPGDERCSITTYATDVASWKFEYPATNTKVAGGCASSDVLAADQTHYDGLGLHAIGTTGRPTRQRTLIDADTDRWSETTTEFDAIGRPWRVTDPNLGVTETTHLTACVSGSGPSCTRASIVQRPIQTTAKNPKNHVFVTDWVPELGAPKHETNANGKKTSYLYDTLGRAGSVWLPTEPLAFDNPSWFFTYDFSKRAVRSSRLVSEVRNGTGMAFHDSWVVYDGLGRERQVQSPSPVSGKTVVAETTYDNSGLVYEETVEQAISGSPGAYLNVGSGGWQNRARHLYDELGRETASQWFRAGASPAWSTSTSYEYDRATVTGPAPENRTVRQRFDGYGRTVGVDELAEGGAVVSSSYVYDLADRLGSVTDPVGNTATYDYNEAGWRTSQADPDRGPASFSYDNLGQQTSVTDAVGNQLHMRYDPLGRPLERRAGSPTGTLLASWEYDASGQLGLLTRSTTHTPTGNWVIEPTGYDDRDRATGTQLTVPAGVPGLTGTYTVGQTYDRGDRAVTATYPAVADLPEETVTTGFTSLGMPKSLTGASDYVSQLNYDDRGRPDVAAFGPAVGYGWMLKDWHYDDDQRLDITDAQVWNGSAYQVVARHMMAYNNSGDLTEKTTLLNGTERRECYGYDARNQLVDAFTLPVGTSPACAAATPAQRGTGTQPYSHSYQYSDDGRLLKRTEDGAATDYAYPLPGSPSQPHAPSQVGSTVHEWDDAGRLDSRTTGAVTEDFAWDAQGQLASISGPEGETSFVYDPSGQRLLRRTASGATLYFAGQEISANASGSSVTAVRSYSFGGSVVATRTAAGADFLVSDAAGSVDLAIPEGSTTPNATRTYAPYGRVQSETGDLDTDRGFIGQVEDSSTGLSYLNARYYDTDRALFLSSDPLYDTTKIKSLNPYSYATGNPTTLSDPTGLSASYTFGIETENLALRAENKALRNHIKTLTGIIESQQDIIKKQQRYITDLLTHISALEAIIRDQQRIIQELQTRVYLLQREVDRLTRENRGLRRTIEAQKTIIANQFNALSRFTRREFGWLGGTLWAVRLSLGGPSALSQLDFKLRARDFGRQSLWIQHRKGDNETIELLEHRIAELEGRVTVGDVWNGLKGGFMNYVGPAISIGTKTFEIVKAVTSGGGKGGWMPGPIILIPECLFEMNCDGQGPSEEDYIA